MIFGALSNAAYRVSLHGPGAELDGGGVFKHPRGQARVKRKVESITNMLNPRPHMGGVDATPR